MLSNIFTNISIFSEIIVADHGICNHDLMKEIKTIEYLLLLFFVIVFNMMTFLKLKHVKLGQIAYNFIISTTKWKWDLNFSDLKSLDLDFAKIIYEYHKLNNLKKM